MLQVKRLRGIAVAPFRGATQPMFCLLAITSQSKQESQAVHRLGVTGLCCLPPPFLHLFVVACLLEEDPQVEHCVAFAKFCCLPPPVLCLPSIGPLIHTPGYEILLQVVQPYHRVADRITGVEQFP
jgi:hypothetical protein